MKITLRDFGPISHFEFDLEKDLHVIFGKNNIGKSYAITAVYLILKHLIDIYDAPLYRKIISREDLPNIIINKIEKDINDIIKPKKKILVDITKYIEMELSEIIFDDFLIELENSFKNSFPPINQLSNTYSGGSLKITLTFNDYTLEILNQGNSLLIEQLKINPIFLAKSSLDRYKSLASDESNIQFKNDDINELSKIIFDLINNLNEEAFSIIRDVYFLPASRSGLYQALNTFSSILVELSQSRNFIRNKIELPNISEPVSDYFLNLSTIEHSSNNHNEFDDVIQFIEENIIKGQVFFNEESKKIYYIQSLSNNSFDLSFTSSMVSEIAPIVAYLKYVIGVGERFNFSGNSNAKFGLLFIEEPEAHLHPEVQVKLMEMFALLAGKNVKIVMTSHSNYMFNKLSNLILEGKIDHNKVGSYLMRATDAGSVTDTLSMKAEADGMNDENFADVAEMLYEERIKIYDKLNKEAKNAD